VLEVPGLLDGGCSVGIAGQDGCEIMTEIEPLDRLWDLVTELVESGVDVETIRDITADAIQEALWSKKDKKKDKK
jgi:hypothetical protein